MSGRKQPPKMLQNVLKAIADLKDSQGSTLRNIVNHINTNTEKSSTKRKKADITPQVRRALTQGTKVGVIEQNARKYKLTTTPSKCNNMLARSHGSRRKRSTGRRKSSKKRRKRRHSESASVSEASDHASEASVPQGGGEISEKSRRRSKQKSKRRSKRRRQQGEESFDDRSENDDDDDNDGDESKKRRRNDPSDNQQLYASEPQECDNPDCLCNVRHETDDRRDSDPDDPNESTLIKY